MDIKIIYQIVEQPRKLAYKVKYSLNRQIQAHRFLDSYNNQVRSMTRSIESIYETVTLDLNADCREYYFD